MTPWMPFNRQTVEANVPEQVLGVFQLSRGGEKVNFVGRADKDLRVTLLSLLDKGYVLFQWVQVPWTKEAFEMNCRLYHHGGGKKLDNEEHPFPPEGKLLNCPLSSLPPALCEL